jgi:hypothetical protein
MVRGHTFAARKNKPFSLSTIPPPPPPKEAGAISPPMSESHEEELQANAFAEAPVESPADPYVSSLFI